MTRQKRRVVTPRDPWGVQRYRKYEAKENRQV